MRSSPKGEMTAYKSFRPISTGPQTWCCPPFAVHNLPQKGPAATDRRFAYAYANKVRVKLRSGRVLPNRIGLRLRDCIFMNTEYSFFEYSTRWEVLTDSHEGFDFHKSLANSTFKNTNVGNCFQGRVFVPKRAA